jgi:hypothetical protein
MCLRIILVRRLRLPDRSLIVVTQSWLMQFAITSSTVTVCAKFRIPLTCQFLSFKHSCTVIASLILPPFKVITVTVLAEVIFGNHNLIVQLEF